MGGRQQTILPAQPAATLLCDKFRLGLCSASHLIHTHRCPGPRPAINDVCVRHATYEATPGCDPALQSAGGKAYYAAQRCFDKVAVPRNLSQQRDKYRDLCQLFCPNAADGAGCAAFCLGRRNASALWKGVSQGQRDTCRCTCDGDA